MPTLEKRKGLVMLYWKQKTEAGTTLEGELLSCKSVKQVKVASAFLSKEGVHILQLIKDTYTLKKDDIVLYISEQFSSNKPHEILNQLSGICVTKVLFDLNFHSKVYLIYGKPNKLIFGSSNFTEGGMKENIEFDHIGVPSLDELSAVTSFFGYCDRAARMVDSDVIKYYKDNQSEIENLYKTQRILSTKLNGFTHREDPFLPDEYDIDDYYFKYEDYETFFPRNRKETGSAISDKRKKVKGKMLAINSLIYPQIKKLGIEHHKSDKNITSLIIPHPINQMSVGWLGIHYGKTPKEVDALNFAKEKDDAIYGFQKHGCIQYSIGEGFEINLFLAVRHDAVDRLHLHQHLFELQPKIEINLAKLKGLGLQWLIWDYQEDAPIATFDVDSENSTDFGDWFKENDHDGYESFLRKYYKPDDPVLKTKESIGNEIVQVTKLLLPLYNTIVWRPKV